MQFIDEAEVLAGPATAERRRVAFRRRSSSRAAALRAADGGNGGDIVLETDERLTPCSTSASTRIPGEERRARPRPGSERARGAGDVLEGAAGHPGPRTSRAARCWRTCARTAAVGAGEGRPGRARDMNFATPTLQAPAFAQRARRARRSDPARAAPAADVGVVGFPTPGRAPLVSRLSWPVPSADYRFTHAAAASRRRAVQGRPQLRSSPISPA